MNNTLKYKSFAKQMNNRVFNDTFIDLMLIAKSVFEWINLPNGMNEKWIEDYLFSEGSCVFFKDKTKGFMVTSYTPYGNLNHYNEEIYLMPVAQNYECNDRVLENNIDCVIIKNNDISMPTAPTIEIYAHKLTTIDRTIDTNILAQKTPVIISCSEKERLSLIQYMEKRNDNEPVIFVTDKMNRDGIKVDDLKVPMVFKDLELQKHMVRNEILTRLGVNNANQDKKERLVTDEVQANNEHVEACFNTMLKARQKACEEINRIFGLKGDKAISVRKRLQTTVMSSSEPTNDSEGGVMNG